MFHRKKSAPNPPPDPFQLPAAFASPVPGPMQSAFGQLQQQAASTAGNTPTTIAMADQLRLQLLQAIKEETSAPEPTGEPKVVVGLTGYRLYGMDKELRLIGARGQIQKGQESGQAKHDDYRDTRTNDERIKGHSAPAWDCLCGFAAFFWPTGLDKPSWEGVLAEVQAGGRTIVCEQGWRAERIALKKLWIACPIFPESGLETLRERYEVPVEVLR